MTIILSLYVTLELQVTLHQQVDLDYLCELQIGTSVRRSSRSAVGRLTGNDVSGHYKRHYLFGTSGWFPVSRCSGG